MLDDNDPVGKPKHLPPVSLDTMGIDEIQDYITSLREEIQRAEAVISRKQSHRSVADGFFRT